MSEDTKRPDYSHLSVPERIMLAQELWESVYERAAELPLSEAEQRELERRWAAYESGTATTSSWAAVKQRLLDR